MDNVTKQLNKILKRHHTLSDDEFSKELGEWHKIIPINMFYNSPHLNEILKRRVKKYCKKNNIKMEEYKGTLPFRSYNIDIKK
jgi:hypothetical protein